MTAYHGGKFRHGKEIADIIKDIYDKQSPDSIVGYIEPFCGMCGVYRHVVNLLPKNLKYIASDKHESLILMWKALQDGWKPPKDCSIEKYNRLKKTPIPSAERGYIGFTFSYGGQFFISNHRRTYGANHIDKSRIISDLAKEMKHVKFYNRDYTHYTPDKYKGYVIYCDPPYQGNMSRYYSEDIKLQKFDSDKFWQWCREMSKFNLVIISEYTAPIDFKPIFSFDSKRCKAKVKTNEDKIEYLYMYKKYFS
jgi:DNA adenine methylase